MCRGLDPARSTGRGPAPARPTQNGSTPDPPATGFEVRRSTHAEVIDLSVSLAAEYAGRVPAGTVIGIVAQARERLLTMGVHAGLVVAVESMSRSRLARLCAEVDDREAPTGCG